MKVMIVDDERPIRQYIAMLIRDCNFEIEDVLEERNPTEVVSRVIDERPDVVFLDISMPQMDGLMVLRKLKQIDNAPEVIIITCHDDFNFARTALQLNALDYVLKDEINTETINLLLSKAKLSMHKDASADNTAEAQDNTQEKIKGAGGSRLISNAINYIRRNYMEDISLNAISKEMFVNSDYFCRKFKKVTGINFSEYLKNVRLEESKKLLKNSNQTITEISNNVGFRNDSYFSHSFKKEYGCSPNDYRKSERNN